MKEINGTKYYSKQEMAEIMGCSIGTINARLIATRIDGIYLGRSKWYTAEQMQQLAEYRNKKHDE